MLAVDRDAGRLAMMEANAHVRGLTGRVETVQADIEAWQLPADIDALWCDPARRESGGRRLHPDRWSPSLSQAVALAATVAGAGIKMAPGIDTDLLPAEGEVEFVSMDRSLRAAVTVGIGAGNPAPTPHPPPSAPRGAPAAAGRRPRTSRASPPSIRMTSARK